MTTPETSGNPSYPRVVGYDMPTSSDAPKDGGASAMIALLDVIPRKEWIAEFLNEAVTFAEEAGIDDARLVGRRLSLFGRPEKLRVLPERVNAFVYRVSRQCLQRRTLARAPEPSAQVPSPAPDAHLVRDLDAIARIVGVPALLEAVTQVTGMRFAAVARVTEERWTACAVHDLIDFGLRPGQDLVLETTICNEIRQNRQLVTFDHASTHPVFATHPTPAAYGFESYISVPIVRADGAFFGTLCALDPKPARLDTAAIQTLEMFARMIGLALDESGVNDAASPASMPA
jgi:hypothetical protein